MPHLSEMTFDELLMYKLKIHHLHRDHRINIDNSPSPQKEYRHLDRLDAILKRIYAELERRKPGYK